MTTAIIGTGGIGSVIARQLASGGEEAPRLAKRRRDRVRHERWLPSSSRCGLPC